MPRTLPITRRHLLGGGLLLASGWACAALVGHRPGSGDSAFLGASALATLTGAFEALLPSEADSAALARGVDAFLAADDPVLAHQLRLALWVLEHVGTRAGGTRGFSRLGVEARRELLAAWRVSAMGTKRQIADAVRKTALFTWYSHPDSWGSIGYDGPLVSQ